MSSLTFRALFASLVLISYAILGGVVQAEDIPVAPAPWTLDVQDGWIFVLPPLLGGPLPPGFATNLEAKVEESTGIRTLSDIGLMLLVRYAASPVGPYDELIYVPGKWVYDDGMKGFRITTIYVSSNASVFNGRQNWNIPKHLANFDFQTNDLGETSVSVTLPGSDKPFFSANLLPTTLPIPIEVNTTLTAGYLNFVQPPIPAGNLPVEIGTTTWKQFLLDGKTATLQANVISGAMPGGQIGDGVKYPDVQPLLPVGVKLSGILDFPVAGVFDSV
ncbi:hypothetical protein GYMLUDRAFT_633942 [Collybiopsis luxurians FD-317 M1]|nr:hypothetical protein GYMLUDRAFT_633942 [Collybiopsis luxurians FD-317 M1]